MYMRTCVCVCVLYTLISYKPKAQNTKHLMNSNVIIKYLPNKCFANRKTEVTFHSWKISKIISKKIFSHYHLRVRSKWKNNEEQFDDVVECEQKCCDDDRKWYKRQTQIQKRSIGPSIEYVLKK